MKILVLNCGSSSLKYQLIDMEKKELLAKGNFERIGENESFLTHKVGSDKIVINKPVETHTDALNVIISELLNPKYNTLSSLDQINGVGHRIVHGGEIFKSSTLIDDETIKNIEKCAAFAPLHNPAAVQGILACKKLMPNTPMVAVFDTAFHQTMPKESYMYPIPYEYYEKYGIRKYGAHGTSHKYVANEAAKLINKDIKDLKIVTCHLGQGASITAVQGGISIDTSMGLTPLGGIPMVTRSGDLDPSVVTYIMEKENISPKDMENILNKKSGLSGVSKMAPDFRHVENMSYENEDAKLVIDIFTEKVAEYILRYASKMRGIDAVVFTGGIGENQANVRRKICERLEFMGLNIDDEANAARGEAIKISKYSKVEAYVIPTDEEMVIAIDTMNLI
ncbi:MAG: acetate kinase [Clostridia bacterium]|nr:acetate kinase [Clostridia bacterium]